MKHLLRVFLAGTLLIHPHLCCHAGDDQHAPQDYVGEYAADAGRIIAVAEFDLGEGSDRLLFLDYQSGRTGMLTASGKDSFTAGPGLLMEKPVDVKLAFTRNAKGEVTGLKFEQNGEAVVQANRSKAFPQQSIRFKNDGVELAGTLTFPHSKGPSPAIVLLHGSEAGRKETFGPLPYFFARHGFVVLAYDKRGDGESTGDWRTSPFGALASDAAAAVAFLKTRKEIDAHRIGIMGNSEGGWVALQANTRVGGAAFLILRVTPAISPVQQDLARIRPILRAEGFSDAEIAEAERLASLKHSFARDQAGWEEYEAAASKARSRPWYSFAGGPAGKDSWWWPWYRTKMDYNPAADLAQIDCPVVAYYGERDLFVLPEENGKRLKQAFAKNKATGFELVVIPKANHAFLLAETGVPSETARLNGFVPLYFRHLSGWLRRILEARRNE